MHDFKNKVAVITGGASGIGEALAWRFAREGTRIVIADVEAVALNAAIQRLKQAGHDVIGVPTDVARADSVAALADLAFNTFGAVDLLFNNAGVVPSGRLRPIWEYPLEDWRWTIDVNLWGLIHGIHSFVPRMLAQGTEGHIVNTASIAGLISGAGSPVYGTTKHAVMRITEALYASLSEAKAPIGVTAVCPGFVLTRIYESERNRPAELRTAGGPAPESVALQRAAPAANPNSMTAEEVADQVIDAIRNRQLYLLSTAGYDDDIRARTDAILARRNPIFPDQVTLAKRDNRRQR